MHGKHGDYIFILISMTIWYVHFMSLKIPKHFKKFQKIGVRNAKCHAHCYKCWLYRAKWRPDHAKWRLLKKYILRISISIVLALLKKQINHFHFCIINIPWGFSLFTVKFQIVRSQGRCKYSFCSIIPYLHSSLIDFSFFLYFQMIQNSKIEKQEYDLNLFTNY